MKLKSFQTKFALLSVMSLAALDPSAGCDVAEGCSPKQDGRLYVSLVDAPSEQYQRIDVQVARLELHSSEQGWVTVGEPNKTVNLLSLVGGVSSTLVSGAHITKGHYQQMRLILGSENSVTLQDGSTKPLKVPSAYSTGIKLTVSFKVEDGTTKDLFIDFDAKNSIHVHGSNEYVLRPVVKVYDKVVTGSVRGTLRNSDGSPIAGAEVFAETTTNGAPTVARATISGADGRFFLDLLPVDASYTVVTQPFVGGVAYAAAAASAGTITSELPNASADLTTGPASASSTLTVAISPAPGSNQADVVSLVQSLQVGNKSEDLIVRQAPGAVNGNSASATFAGVPYASYTASATRTTVDGEGAVSATQTSSAAATTADAPNVSVSVSF